MKEPFDFLKELEKLAIDEYTRQLVRDFWAKHHLEKWWINNGRQLKLLLESNDTIKVKEFRGITPLSFFHLTAINHDENAEQVELVWDKKRIEAELKKKMEEEK